ncbi:MULTISPECIES: uracil-DNA glycosylase family protein [Myroides]|uniref:Uracil-DNA glycosylase family protein n=1 Tax=Myroides albus TaxID=2562892 RepID=A0A6I3LNG8_9FLAO|nr:MULTISPECIES: uracil-DNA glycosylase family protein [Myroides]MTG99424.1 uracil-DNA glycosylase family protein [Myroides albus]MVX35935.1 uracil-DNA glycosylase family protein [Myroides sp. LoEW2-1]UVD80425.1 uracil-DNA glycosylase family protein [Myroides albus]
MEDFKTLLCRIRECKICEDELPLGANPIVLSAVDSKIIIIGQAPGLKVHNSGIPFKDKSGEQLRKWLGVTEDEFYNTSNFSIIPMGFCYPGKGKNGDLPPKKVCAPTWHPLLLTELKSTKLILLVGQYAQNYYLNSSRNLTENVYHFHDYLPTYFPLPHPSPRNNIWKAKNKWFEDEVVPVLRHQVDIILGKSEGN